MPNRSLVMTVVVAISSSFVLSAPTKAGFVTTVVAVNTSGQAANDFEATFTGTGGSISDINVTYSSGVNTTTEVIGAGTGVEINFGTALSDASTVIFKFTTSGSDIGLSTAEWTFNSGSPINATGVSVTTAGGTVPEPASVALLGIGMAGLYSCRWLFKRKADV
jgi:hypothetical protein